MDRIVDYIAEFMDGMKQVDLKKQARNMRNRVPEVHLPEVNLPSGSFGSRDFLMGLVVGGLVGFVAAMLFAPKSGEETRALIGDKTRSVGEKAKDTIEGAVDKTGRLAAEGRDRVESTLKRGQKQVDATKAQGRDVANQARERVSDTLDRASDEIDPNRRF